MADRRVRTKVLIVDDDRDARAIYRAYLVQSGCEVRTARDGHRAIDKAHAYVPDVIVMDLAMPNLDGWTASTWLKMSPATAHIPIIALSAHAMMGDAEKALQSGCDDYLSKPLDEDLLFAKLAKFLGE